MRSLYPYKRIIRNIWIFTGEALHKLARVPTELTKEPDRQNSNTEHQKEPAAGIEKENDISPGKLFDRTLSLNIKLEMGTSPLPIPSGMTRFFDIYSKTINSTIHE